MMQVAAAQPTAAPVQQQQQQQQQQTVQQQIVQQTMQQHSVNVDGGGDIPMAMTVGGVGGEEKQQGSSQVQMMQVGSPAGYGVVAPQRGWGYERDLTPAEETSANQARCLGWLLLLVGLGSQVRKEEERHHTVLLCCCYCLLCTVYCVLCTIANMNIGVSFPLLPSSSLSWYPRLTGLFGSLDRCWMFL